MAAISGKNTQPELKVRRAAYALGYRFRLHRRDLPGRPDIVFPSLRKIIEVRGCFWHRHSGCKNAVLPKTRAGFWQAKFDATVSRDERNLAALEALGWQTLIVWECETGDYDLCLRLADFLGNR